MVRFLEKQGKLGRIDAENWVLYDVRINGYQSRNNRRYTKKAIEQTVSLLDGAKVFDGHSSSRDGTSDIVGVIKSPRLESDGAHADIHLLKTSPAAARILELSQKEPKAVAVSHEVSGESYTESDGTEIVESIDEVLGVAIVCYPGITNGLWESTGAAPADSKTLPLKLFKQILDEVERGLAAVNSDEPRHDLIDMINAVVDMIADDPTAGASAARVANAARSTIVAAMANPLELAGGKTVHIALQTLRQLVGLLPGDKPDEETTDDTLEPEAVSPSAGQESEQYRRDFEERTGIAATYVQQFEAAAKRRRG